jgi:hypothetical protein
VGKRLADLYAKADAIGGFPAKVRLAGLVGITSTQAGSIPDTPELIDRCEVALVTMGIVPRPGAQPAGGKAAPAGPAPAIPVAPGTGQATESRLRRFHQIIADVLGQRSVFFARPEESFARLTEAAVLGLGVARASVWFYDAKRTLIRSADLFERDTGRHSSGVELSAASFPHYFAALETERTIAAHDAHKDPRTIEFSAPYLTPLGIGAMLDVPVWVEGRMVGVVCHEHVGGALRWTSDDENFAHSMAGFVALAEERRRAKGGAAPVPRAVS